MITALKDLTPESSDCAFINCDCMDGMRKYPDKYFDIAIVDPPYGDGGGGKTEGGERFGQRFDKYKQCGGGYNGFGGWFQRYKFGTGGQAAIGGQTESLPSKVQEIEWDIAPTEEYLKELFRISKNQIIWGGNYFSLPPTRCFLIWRKTNIPENFSMAMCEYAWTSFSGNSKVFEMSSIGIPGRFHPTQKPVPLYAWVLSKFAKSGNVILDTHVGSASSLIACHKGHFRFVGFEKDKFYYDMALKRLNSEMAQVTIYDLLGKGE